MHSIEYLHCYKWMQLLLLGHVTPKLITFPASIISVKAAHGSTLKIRLGRVDNFQWDRVSDMNT